MIRGSFSDVLKSCDNFQPLIIISAVNVDN